MTYDSSSHSRLPAGVLRLTPINYHFWRLDRERVMPSFVCIRPRPWHGPESVVCEKITNTTHRPRVAVVMCVRLFCDFCVGGGGFFVLVCCEALLVHPPTTTTTTTTTDWLVATPYSQEVFGLEPVRPFVRKVVVGVGSCALLKVRNHSKKV